MGIDSSFIPGERTEAVADPECVRGGGVSHILAEKGVLASLYSKTCMKIQYFHQ